MLTVVAILCALLAVSALPNDQKLMDAEGNEFSTPVMRAFCSNDKFKLTVLPMRDGTNYNMKFQYYDGKKAYVSDSSAHVCSTRFTRAGFGVSCESLTVDCSKITDPTHREFCQSVTETDQGYTIFCYGLYYDNFPKECAVSSKGYRAKLLCNANVLDI
ncbi:hypothetical protein MP638_001833 [Amoeboaphelidium occidentale]|nr:hypothetical protein MP638_001833 [Amoeboaphelidium occidentale]